MAAIAALTFGSIETVTENSAPARRIAAITLAAYTPSRSDHDRPGAPGFPRGGDGFGGEAGGAAAEAAFPPRSRVAAITGPASGVLITAVARSGRGPAGICPRFWCARPGALLLVPVNPFLHRVDGCERQHVLAPRRRPARASYRQRLSDFTASRLAHVSRSRYQRQVRTPAWTAATTPNSASMAPCRGPCRRCCSAPAIIPATSSRSSAARDPAPGRRA